MSNVINFRGNEVTTAVAEEQPKEQLTVFRKTQPIEDLIVRSKEIQQTCADFVVPSSHIDFGVYKSEVPKLLFESYDLRDEESVSRNFDMTDYAFGQLCSKIGVPARFMKKCMKDKHPQLVADAVDTYLKDQGNKTMFVRANGDHIRGILSEKYSVLDTPDILESISDVLPDAPVKGYFMNDERFHARLLGSPLNVPNEDLFWGIQIDSSDVGRSILTAKFLLYKQVCTNGLTVSKGGGILFEQKHIGITREEFITSFREGLSSIPNVAKALVEDIKESKDKLSYKEVAKLIQKSIDSLKLDTKVEDTLIELTSKYGQNRWGVVNSLTEFAQKYTLERRLEIENYAGILLTA